MTFQNIVQLYQLGLISSDETLSWLRAEGYLPEPGAKPAARAPYQRQSGVLTQIVADLKADGQSKNTVLGFFVSVVEAKYDAVP